MALKKAASDFEMQMHSDLKDVSIFPSRYEFLRAHNGIRPNCLHGMIGTTGCLSGDTVVRLNRNGNGRKYNLKDLCIKFGEYPGLEDKKSFNDIERNKIRSYSYDEDRIVLKSFIKVIYKGIRPLFEIKLKDGKSLKCTQDHKIMTKRGMIELGDLKLKDDKIMTDSSVRDVNIPQGLPVFCGIDYIIPIGDGETFDVYEVYGTNNFTANDIVVSNCGKSTLVKCIIAEAAMDKKVLVWMSEENVVEYQHLISFLDKSVLKNISFVEEKEIPQEYRENQDKFFEYFEQMVEESGCELVFIDNMTSSAFYNMRFGFNGQGRTAEFLSSFVKTKCAVFYIAHTETMITDNYSKVVAPENMRGSKELAIVTEYMYIIQKFTTNDKIYNVMRVAKFRHHKEAAGWYALKFEHSSYIGDSKVPFELINKIFKSRDYLGRASPKVAKPADETPQRKMDLTKDKENDF